MPNSEGPEKFSHDLGFVSGLSLAIEIVAWLLVFALLTMISPVIGALWFIGYLVFWFLGPLHHIQPGEWLTDLFDRYINRDKREKHAKAVRIRRHRHMTLLRPLPVPSATIPRTTTTPATLK